ncbi:nucleic acid/nucleotide deaminase domain-containing protein [Paenibacillus sp. JJ-223]|uniref:nucleic acid/nucleotide deaminase domain-containing protein n=1 Tax=Paenibacillus sp. JJ-223 TaxID=2905647 RepID=UPI001F38A737|nr:nucleic acid/nucleotide deaminase domain-containing protein [Paenibacillus sp. JJ-223]CAH1228374.1 hypothetical protein PAECIP111890_06273 [Paenibacillus sp. JJ-223]
MYLLAAADAALGAAMIVVNVKKLNDLKNGDAYTNPTFLGMDQQLLDNLGVALMLVNLAMLAKHGLNKAADKLVNSKNMSALDETWTRWKQQTKDRLNKSVDDITDYVSDSIERMRNTRFGQEFAMDGPNGVYFTKPKKPIPPNSQQQRFWSEMEAGKDDLAKKLDEGTGNTEFGLSRSKVVGYGESDLSRMVIDYRMKNGVQGTRNIAILEYEDNGILKYEIAESNRELGVHSEEILHQRVTEMGIDSSKIKRIYTERQPCNLEPYHHCDNLIYKNYPNAEVTHSFEYGDYDSRKRGNDEMKKAIKALFK